MESGYDTTDIYEYKKNQCWKNFFQSKRVSKFIGLIPIRVLKITKKLIQTGIIEKSGFIILNFLLEQIENMINKNNINKKELLYFSPSLQLGNPPLKDSIENKFDNVKK